MAISTSAFAPNSAYAAPTAPIAVMYGTSRSLIAARSGFLSAYADSPFAVSAAVTLSLATLKSSCAALSEPIRASTPSSVAIASLRESAAKSSSIDSISDDSRA